MGNESGDVKTGKPAQDETAMVVLPDGELIAPEAGSTEANAAEVDRLNGENLALSDKLAEANIAREKAETDLLELKTAPVTPDPRIGELEAEIERLKGLLVSGDEGPANPQDEFDAAAAEAEMARAAAEAEKARKAAEKEAEKAAKARQAKIDACRAAHDEMIGANDLRATAFDRDALINGGDARLLLSDGSTFHPDFSAEVTARDVTLSGDDLILNAALDLPTSGDSFQLSAAVLLMANGHYLACAIGPLPIGGGMTASVPSGHLLFRFAPDTASPAQVS